MILLYVSLNSNHYYYKLLNSEDFSCLTCIGVFLLPLTLSLCEYAKTSNYYPKLSIIPGSESIIPPPIFNWWLCFTLSIASTLISEDVLFLSFMIGGIANLLLLNTDIDSNPLLFPILHVVFTLITGFLWWPKGTLMSWFETLLRLY